MPIPQPGSELAEPRMVFKGGFEDRVGGRGHAHSSASVRWHLRGSGSPRVNRCRRGRCGLDRDPQSRVPKIRTKAEEC